MVTRTYRTATGCNLMQTAGSLPLERRGKPLFVGRLPVAIGRLGSWAGDPLGCRAWRSAATSTASGMCLIREVADAFNRSGQELFSVAHPLLTSMRDERAASDGGERRFEVEKR